MVPSSHKYVWILLGFFSSILMENILIQEFLYNIDLQKEWICGGYFWYTFILGNYGF